MEPTTEIRRAEPTDAGEVRRLTREAYAKWVPIIGREPKPMTADYDLAVRDHEIDLLYVDGILAGLVEMIHQGSELLVENVAIEPAFQGSGLGTKLMGHAEDIARSRGCSRIWLYTNKRMEVNIRLYWRLGYVTEREEDIGGGLTRVFMGKQLSV